MFKLVIIRSQLRGKLVLGIYHRHAVVLMSCSILIVLEIVLICAVGLRVRDVGKLLGLQGHVDQVEKFLCEHSCPAAESRVMHI